MSATGIYTANGGYNFGAGNLGIYAPNGGFNIGSQNVLNPANYGVTSNGKVLSDVTTGASNVISSASYQFNPADVGKLISIPGAIAGVTGNASGYLNTTIASVANGQATLTTAATQVIAGTAVATFGTDDTVAFQKMVNAAGALPNGGTILLPSATIIISSINWLPFVSVFGQGFNASIVKHISVTDSAGSMFWGNAGGQVLYTDCQFQNFQMDMEAATTTSGYQVFASCLRLLQPLNTQVTNCYLHGSPATCLALDYGTSCAVSNNIIANYGRNATAGSFGGAGMGSALNATASWTVTGNTFIAPTTANSTYGCFFESEAAGSAEGEAIVSNNVFEGPGTLACIGDTGLRRFICIGNKMVLPTGSLNTGSGIAVIGGTTSFGAGIRGQISENVITLMPGDGIKIDNTAGVDAGQYDGYIINNNRIQACAGHAIRLVANATTAMKNITIQNNYMDGNHFCAVVTLGAGGFNGLVINGNTAINNCTTGSGITTAAFALDVGNIADITMIGNRAADNGTGTQKYGIGIAVTVTGAFFSDNNLQNNATGGLNIFSGSIAGILTNNPGYNPVGASAGGLGVSPATFTAPSSPGTLFISAGTSITALTQNGTSILPVATSAGALLAVPFNANDVIVVTYTGALTSQKMVN